MKRVVLFDIDHTLSDAAHRDHLIPAALQSGDWAEYHDSSVTDGPCHDIVDLLTCFRHCDYQVIGITARPDLWRATTMGWLHRHRIWLDELLMRPQIAFTPSPELKLALVRDRFGANFADQILFIVDDREDVAKAFAEFGVTSLQVRGRNYGRSA